MGNLIEMKRQALTRQFCVRFGLRAALASVDGAEGAQYCAADGDASLKEACRSGVQSYDREPVPGEVWLLAKARRLTYVLVAQDMGDGQFLVIPFSSYASPANAGELLVKNPGGAGTRVLQLWNAKVWTRPSVAEGWRVGALPEEEIEDALSAWRWAVGLVAPGEDVVSRTGTRVADCEATVRAYVKEERENLSAINAKDAKRLPWFLAVQARRTEQNGQSDPIVEKTPCAQAAGEEKTSAVRRAECRVDGFDGLVLVVYNGETGELALDAYGPDGNPSAALDGWLFVDADGNELFAIKGTGVQPVKVGAFGGSCFLIDGESGIHALTRVSE